MTCSTEAKYIINPPYFHRRHSLAIKKSAIKRLANLNKQSEVIADLDYARNRAAPNHGMTIKDEQNQKNLLRGATPFNAPLRLVTSQKNIRVNHKRLRVNYSFPYFRKMPRKAVANRDPSRT